MKLLAIDQSFTSTGLVLLEDDVVTLALKVTTDKNDDIYARTWTVIKEILTVIEQHRPDASALEGLAYGGTGNATRDLAGLQFALITHLRYHHNLDISIIAPTQVKRRATGKGNANKQQMVEALPSEVRALFDAIGVKKTTGLQDLSDAYWIGITARELNDALCK